MEFGRVALWSASRHSTSHQYDHWKVVYLSSSCFLSPGFSLHACIFTKADCFLHNHWKCVCSQWCSVPLYHLTRLLVGFGSSKGLKVEGINLGHHLCESFTGLLPLWGNQRPHNKPRWRRSRGELCHQCFLPPDDSNMTHVPLNLRKTNLVKTSEKFGSGKSFPALNASTANSSL